MKAIRANAFGGPEVLELEEIDAPRAGPGELVIDLKAIGVNPAETYMRTGVYAVVPDLPYTPGGDAAGIVAGIGAGVTGFESGDRVFTGVALSADMTGCYAEQVVRRAEHVMAIPEGVSEMQAAAFGVPYATAHWALFSRGGATSGETVFIHGASGAVGTAAIQLAKRAGLTVVGSAGTSKGLDLVRAEGADLAVDHTADGYVEEVRAFTGGEGPALILEMLANVNLATDMDLARRFGRIVIIGARGEVTIPPRVAMMKELDIRGVALWNVEHAAARAMMDDILAGCAEGALSPVIGREMPLAEAAAAHIAVLEPGAHGKIVLIP